MIAYLSMALLSAIALLLLTRPWWQRSGERLARRGANVSAYQGRLDEIDAEQAAGLLDAQAAEQLRQEQGSRLLTEAEAPEAVAVERPSRLWWIMLLLPLFAASWYALSGSWRLQQLVELAEQDPAAAQQQSVESMVQRLAERLRQHPEDAEGWAMLGRSYTVLERFTESAEAYAKANALAETPQPDWLVGQGEALALSRDRNLQGEPQRLFEAAVALEPGHVAGLWFSGLAAAQREDAAATRRYWNALLQLPIPDDLRAIVTPRLAALGGEAPSAPVAAGLSLTVDVSLAPALKKDFNPQYTLFVFAKAQEGPPMPLAVRKLQPSQLPVTVQLDDSLAMMPQLKLSQFSSWVVQARLSASGAVAPQSGDLEGSVMVSREQAGQPVRLVIDRRLP